MLYEKASCKKGKLTDRNGYIKYMGGDDKVHKLFFVGKDNKPTQYCLELSSSDALSSLMEKSIETKKQKSYYTTSSNINDIFKIFLFA